MILKNELNFHPQEERCWRRHCCGRTPRQRRTASSLWTASAASSEQTSVATLWCGPLLLWIPSSNPKPWILTPTLTQILTPTYFVVRPCPSIPEPLKTSCGAGGPSADWQAPEHYRSEARGVGLSAATRVGWGGVAGGAGRWHMAVICRPARLCLCSTVSCDAQIAASVQPSLSSKIPFCEYANYKVQPLDSPDLRC